MTRLVLVRGDLEVVEKPVLGVVQPLAVVAHRAVIVVGLQQQRGVLGGVGEVDAVLAPMRRSTRRRGVVNPIPVVGGPLHEPWPGPQPDGGVSRTSRH
jgi:hypothetical protein